METSLCFDTPALPAKLRRLRARLAEASPLLVGIGVAPGRDGTFVRALTAEVHPRWQGCHIVAEPGWSSRDLVDAIAGGLGLDLAEGPTGVRLARLARALRAHAAGDRVTLVVVDAAHGLSPEPLGVLAGIAAGGWARSGMRALLLGRSELAPRLEASRARLGGRGFVSLFEMPSFAEDELEGFMRRHLHRAGLSPLRHGYISGPGPASGARVS